MTGALVSSKQDEVLAVDVLAHLDEQLLAARRLLGIVLAQGTAIRARDVREVVRHAGLLQAEMEWRALLEESRTALLARAGGRLGVLAATVTLTMLCSLFAPEVAAAAAKRSAELRGLLAEIQREHMVNRAMMSQELQFLDHLLRLSGQTAGVYGAGGERSPAGSEPTVRRLSALDMEA